MSEIKVKDFEIVLTGKETRCLAKTEKILRKVYNDLSKLDKHNYNTKTNIYKTDLMTTLHSLNSICKRIDFCNDKKGELKRTS